MNTRAISTSVAVSACDICGRTLLRGERAETYVNGAERHSVCELCTSRALQGGWVREGTIPAYEQTGARVDRRRSFFSRLRARREAAPSPEPAGDEPSPFEFLEDSPSLPAAAATGAEPTPAPDPFPATPAPVPAPPPFRAEPTPRPARPARREPRHVRAVPTSTEHKISSAVSLFNQSEHPRTVAGISRSLGLPAAAALPSGPHSGLVHIVVAWELCWYRYEVELSDEVPSVRLATQGYELSELSPEEQRSNVAVDEQGTLSLG